MRISFNHDEKTVTYFCGCFWSKTEEEFLTRQILMAHAQEGQDYHCVIDFKVDLEDFANQFQNEYC